MLAPPDFTDRQWHKLPQQAREFFRAYKRHYRRFHPQPPLLPLAAPVPLFAILSEPRSGTQMLLSALAKHPGIIVPHRRLLTQILKGYVPNLDRQSLMLDAHTDDDERKDERKGLLSQVVSTSPACILLTRENHLRQFLSRRLADTTGNSRVDRPRKGQHPIEIPIAELWRHHAAMARCRKRVVSLFPVRYEVTYEKLLAEWAQEITAILTHLNLPPLPLAPTTYKQDYRPLATAIANFKQVAASVRRRGFAHWLD